MVSRFAAGHRHAGVLVPLCSMPSTRSWGIGEIGDIEFFAAWMRAARLDILQLLPVSEMSDGQSSPYSMNAAMAFDPIFISVYAVDDFAALGGEQVLAPKWREILADVRLAPRIDYGAVRTLKMYALRLAFDRFADLEWRNKTEPALSLAKYIDDERWWLDDYALFRATRADHAGREWTSWPEDIRLRQSTALDRVRAEFGREVLFWQYVQWIADEQWQKTRRAAPDIGIFGDFPFTVGSDSADVWANQEVFDLDASVGAPPDEFAATGQDWGLPAYRWDVMAERDFDWLRARARRAAALFDAFRVDHIVGFYRTYVRPHDGRVGQFTPPDEDRQIELGEHVLAVLGASDCVVVVEDLGTVPDFVRASLKRLGVPGYKVLRWEREWHTPSRPFRDPIEYPPRSIATTGTHDTDTLSVWWETMTRDERELLAEIPALRQAPFDPATVAYTPAVRDALIEMLYGSGSDFLILPIQDVFGWRDRINVPGVVSPDNWTYRMPWPSDEWRLQTVAHERAVTLARWAQWYGRT